MITERGDRAAPILPLQHCRTRDTAVRVRHEDHLGIVVSRTSGWSQTINIDEVLAHGSPSGIAEPWVEGERAKAALTVNERRRARDRGTRHRERRPPGSP